MDVEAEISLLENTLKMGGRTVKAKLAGLGILLLVILLAAVYTMFGRSRTAAEIPVMWEERKSVFWRMKRSGI